MLKGSLLLPGGDCLLKWYAVIVCSRLREEGLIGAIALIHKHVNKITAQAVMRHRHRLDRKNTYNHIVWEARVKGRGLLDALDLLGGQRDVQRGDVLLELFDFAATDDGEHVW
jgi:hypothetical protein